jgi:hypothetical protein
MYSMSSDVVELPVGGMIRKKTSPEVRICVCGLGEGMAGSAAAS